jgi:serine/threonine protein kinase
MDMVYGYGIICIKYIYNMPTVPKVIGEGTYGCVHKPALKCKGKRNIRNKISKTMLTRDAIMEVSEYSIMSNTDKLNLYHLGKPILCAVDHIQPNIDAIQQCSKMQNFININDVSLLIMNDGGNNLTQFSEKMKNEPKNSANTEIMEHFWLDMHNILMGLQLLNDNDIVHHDLKPQNIVYNTKTREMKMIDFGLMTKKSHIKSLAETSRYPYNFIHWSFPFEFIFYNKNRYERVVSEPMHWRVQFYNGMISKFQSSSGSNDDQIKNMRTFFNYMSISNYSVEYNKNLIKKYWRDFYTFMLSINKQEYNAFIDKSISTIDIYGVGIALSDVLSNTHQHISEELRNRLFGIIYKMTNPIVSYRIPPELVVSEYESILEDSGILLKYGLYFENNHLLKITSKSITASPSYIPSSIAKQINSITLADISMNKKQLSQVINQKITLCPPEKELNPTTQRCNKKCKTGYVRNSSFKCVKAPKETNPAIQIQLASCPPGKEMNPKTRRCNKTCKTGYVRNSDFKCVRAANKTRKR